MAVKTVIIDGIGPVSIYKRRNSRHIRLSVGAGGQAKVSLPTWAPYKAGISFARSKADWIVAQLARTKVNPLQQGQTIGKKHNLLLVADTATAKIRTRVNQAQVIVKFPRSFSPDSAEVQQAADKACQRALKKQAEDYIPTRLQQLSQQHGLKFSSIEIRHLKSRWGSCNQKREVKISLFIMKLPNELIDYVLMHELVHTKHLNHGPNFWNLLESINPSAKSHRKALHAYQPTTS